MHSAATGAITTMGPPPRPAALAVAFFLLLADVRHPSAVPVSTTSTSRPALLGPQTYSVDLAASIDAQTHDEPVVVYGSGRRLRASAHRRILDVLHAKAPVTVRLASGEERTFPSGRDYMAHAHAADLEGAQFLVPAEAFPCDVVGDVVETEQAQQTHVVLPSGESVPLQQHQLQLQQLPGGAPHAPPRAAPQLPDAVRYPGCNPYQHHPLYHRQPAVYDWMTPFGADVPEDRLLVALGGTQRLSMKVHDAILHCFEAKRPVDVDLISGKRVTVDTYDDLLGRMVDPHYLNAKVTVAEGVKVPVSTYRAVVDAHKHRGVYVVDPDDDHRMLYEDYVRRRAASSASADKKPEKKAR